ncbi:hypothetical protein CBP51_05050 [Cellvibrio mixtus]|uniref:Carrier domain-containing protein n=2 Tax=Cellvibrio mixtus TaxID=39650 RepID=A0A266Q924_9GAMM|nr:hypothetical protein CBP51_05050 [Cellvibrio mixtus]
MSDGNDPYIMSFLFEISKRSNLDAVLEGLQFIVDRHDVFRTAIMWEGLTEPVQVVYRKAELPVQWLEFGEVQNTREHMQLRCAPDKQWMDLTQAPLFKVSVAKDHRAGYFFIMLQFHHSISDHVGFEIIQKEIAAFRSGLTHLLPDPRPYREFVAHVRHHSGKRDAEKFFREMLGDIDEPIVPFGLTDLLGDGRRINRHNLDIDVTLAQAIRRASQQLRISPAAIFHAAWAMVISMCSRCDDVVFGTVFSGRLQGTAGIEHMMGVFINTLPIRVKLTNLSASALVVNIQASLLELLRFEQSSLAEAQRCSGLQGGIPLFNAILNYRHSARERSELDGAAFEPDDFNFLAGEERTNYPISVSVDDFGVGFGIDMQVHESLSASHLAGYLVRALEQLLPLLSSGEKIPVHTLPLLSEREVDAQLIASDGSAVEFAQVCIHELFEERVRLHPHIEALNFEGDSLTYGELNQRANRLAHYLIDTYHVKPDTLVGIACERSLDMVIAIYAVLKAGGAYVPLDHQAPADRIAFMLDDAALAIVLTQQHLKNLLDAQDRHIICIDDPAFQQRLANCPDTNPVASHRGLTPNHLAYVIYTSGSTGTPKGVLCEHAGLVNRITWMQNQYSLGADDSVLQKTPYTFDVSVWEFMWPLTQGARLVIAKPEGHKDPFYLTDLIQLEQITVLHFVPSMLGTLLAVADWRACDSTRKVFCSGEALPLALQQQFFATGTRCELHNLYGPTEASIDVSYWRCESQSTLKTVPIGRPIANTQLYVLDEHRRVLPAGVIGELYIGGVGLARGYLNRAGLTAQCFIDNPFYTRGTGKRLYKTGDLVRRLPDGNLDYIGRVDDQVKIRGLRIELGEIEYVLSRYEDVASSVVVAREDEPGNKYLVAYVVRRQAPQSAADHYDFIQQLSLHVQRALPQHMHPHIVLLEQLPLSANGKINRKELPKPEYAHHSFIYITPVEIAAIENQLQQYPGVANARVFVRNLAHDKKTPVAYILSAPENLLPAQEWVESIWASLERNLPEYLLPSAIVAIDEFPLTPEQHIDINALPKPDAAAYREKFLVAETAAEKAIATMWMKLLKLDEIRVTDSFFHLGGHSLLAVRLASEINQYFDVTLSVKAIFECKNIRQIAAYVDGLLIGKDIKNNVVVDAGALDSEEIMEI